MKLNKFADVAVYQRRRRFTRLSKYVEVWNRLSLLETTNTYMLVSFEEINNIPNLKNIWYKSLYW